MYKNQFGACTIYFLVFWVLVPFYKVLFLISEFISWRRNRRKNKLTVLVDVHWTVQYIGKQKLVLGYAQMLNNNWILKYSLLLVGTDVLVLQKRWNRYYFSPLLFKNSGNRYIVCSCWSHEWYDNEREEKLSSVHWEWRDRAASRAPGPPYCSWCRARAPPRRTPARTHTRSHLHEILDYMLY